MMEIFAHRGYSAIYPENTILAFAKAIEVGAHGLELDVQLTQDEELIVIHDATVDRTTNGTGRVDSLTLGKLLTLDAGAKKGIAFEHEQIPTLEAVLETFRHKTQINIELKNSPAKEPERLIDRVLDLLESFGLRENIILSSFKFSDLVKAKSRLPELRCALNAEKGIKGFWARSLFKHSNNVDALHPCFEDVTEKLVRHEHVCQRKVRAWVVNESYDLMRMQQMEIDAVITDDPVFALTYSEPQ